MKKVNCGRIADCIRIADCGMRTSAPVNRGAITNCLPVFSPQCAVRNPDAIRNLYPSDAK